MSQHKCPWPFCTARVDADLWGCRSHWFTIPPELRKALWAAYKRGQTLATASKAYLDASAAIDTWIALHLQTKGVQLGETRKGPRARQVEKPPQGDLPL